MIHSEYKRLQGILTWAVYRFAPLRLFAITHEAKTLPPNSQVAPDSSPE
jgi:hypothetical protein